MQSINMRIVSWNCNGALRRKTNELDALNADLLVIQECEDPRQSIQSYLDWSGKFAWCGSNKNKGIGIFARNNTHLSPLPWNKRYKVPGAPNASMHASWMTNDLKEFAAVRINDKFNLVGVWTKQAPNGTFGYAGQLWKYLQSHLEDIAKDDCVLIGDLNSNVQWDRPDRWWNHSDNVLLLESIGMKSLYHKRQKYIHGNESQPTFYLHRDLKKAYHIDYAFLSKTLVDCSTLKILPAKKWLTLSDHMPLVVDIHF